MEWETDDSRSEADLSLDKDSSGTGGHLTFKRTPTKDPHNKEYFLVKGIFKKFPSEVTCSITLEHLSVHRPRSLTFLHSYAEAYTEVVLDIFKSEEDQIIIVANRKPQEKSFRVGQFGNNFLQMYYKTLKFKDQETNHQSVLAEIGGKSVEIKMGLLNRYEEECHWMHLILGTPNMAPNHNMITLCPRQNMELAIQILGIEEKEGPYLSMGEISGPGGVGLQLGGGRLHPIDTPPALTFTAALKERFLEILFDCQINSMNQFQEDLHSRKRAIEKALDKFHEIEFDLKGTLALDKAIKDTERLINDIIQVLDPFKNEILASMDEDLLEQISISREILSLWIDSKKIDAINSLNETSIEAKRSLEEILVECQKWIKQKEFYVHEVVDKYTHNYKEFLGKKIWPTWIKIHGGARALRFNDNQSLYALTSRIMSWFHLYLGRQKGFSGFLVNDVMRRIEQIIARKMRWETIRKEVYNFIRILEKVIPMNFKRSHDTAFKIQIASPKLTWPEAKDAFNHLRDVEFSRYTDLLKSKIQQWKARLLYLKAWEVKGTSTLIGWEQAISWDGRFLSPLLSDSCPHLLIMLTRSSSPIAITLELQKGSHSVNKLITFISRNNHVAVHSDLKILINGSPFQTESEILADLHIQKLTSSIRISSSEGVALECHVKGDLCTLEIGKENFAATAGLLGVFDFETNTDFMTSAWERPASPSEWSSSWRLSPNRECFDAPRPASLSSNQDEMCFEVFSGEDSPFSECLNTVPSRPFIASCVDGKKCSAEEALKMECHNHFIGIPDQQLSCGTPEVRLLLKSDLEDDLELEESNDVYLDCLATADPPVTNIQFFKENSEVTMNQSQGILLSGSALALQNIHPGTTGSYKCLATNAIGASESNVVQLRFKHKPVCSASHKIIEATKGEMVVLECKVKADPDDVIFSWSFNNGNEYIQLSESTYNSFRLESRLKFVPKSEIDFGHVRCWARNEMGTQSEPCEFVVRPQTDSGTCSEPQDERIGTDYLRQEVVFIGDFSCFDSLKHITQVLQKESKRTTSLKLRYTSPDNLPNSSEEFESVIASFDLSPLEVVSAAIREDFSKDSLKAIVLFNCQARECKSTDQKDINDALSLSTTMRDLGIQLYLVTKEAIVLKDPQEVPNKVKRQLLGIDRTTTYLMSHARKKNLKGKRGIRKHLSLPENNLCAELSMQTDGALFSLKAMKKLKKNNHKRVFKQLIAFRLLKGFEQDYLNCRNCACQELCKLCQPVQPFQSEILDSDDSDEEEEDYFYT